MVSSLRILASALVMAASLPVSAHAASGDVTYTCDVAPSHDKAWIPEVLFIGHDTHKSRVVVSDPLVLHFNNRMPVEGRIASETAKRTTFVWSYLATDHRGKRARMQFQATWHKDTQKITVQATPAGFTKRFRGTGSCEIRVH